MAGMLEPDVRLTALRKARYLGGHPSAPHAVGGIDIEFTTNGTSFRRRNEILGSLE
jgi:hypothetical protein